ncbi:MAG: tRNA 2-thiouridine(34) synthase MnmA [Phycisphaerales bacterium]|nr:tRNA 2-thiouridine(34) synthase MnmA [Phycisphaerales bacterium]
MVRINVSKGKVVVAMSGGVDSSVAAALLLQQGYEVLGVFLRLGTPEGVQAAEETCELSAGQAPVAGAAAAATGTTQPASRPRAYKHGCCSVMDAADARRVAGLLDIPFYVLNFQNDFSRVIDYFVAEYNAGRTPNPCVRCNDWLKFGKLAQYAEAVGACYTASGHYARMMIDPLTGEKAIARGLDHRKDQSYVLFGMSRHRLDHMLLPIGAYEKHEVRQLAEQFNLPVFNKPDSQEICFVPDQDYAGLVKRRSPDSVRPGELVMSDGSVVGQHQGHQHFTIGQRKGVGMAFGRPIYVVNINSENNQVMLGEKEQLLCNSLVANQVNVLSSRVKAGQSLGCLAKIRYNHEPQPAQLFWDGADRLDVRFDQPQVAITPGQAVVCYQDDVVVCGGWIESAQ